MSLTKPFSFAFAIVSISHIALAQVETNVTVHSTETLIVEYVGDNGDINEGTYGDDDDFWTTRNLLNFQANSQEFDGGLRIDTTLFFYPPQAVDADEFEWGPGSDNYTLLNYHNDSRIERIYGTLKCTNFQLTAGDFHVTFGRGMALSLIKLDDVGLDNALRGGKFEYTVMDRLRLTVLGGITNALNIDPLTRQILEDDPMDRIFGARAELTATESLAVSLHGVIMRPRFTKETEVTPDRMYIDQSPGVSVNTIGGSINPRFKNLSVYLESNFQTHDNYRPPPDLKDVINEKGYAVFGEIIYDVTPLTLKGEGLFYKKWLMDGPLRGSASNIVATQPITYQHLVTLEPSWMPIKSIGNAGGGKISGNFFWNPTHTEINLATLVMDYEGGLTPQGDWSDRADTLILHPMLEFRQFIGKQGFRVTTKGGYRHEWKTTDSDQEGYLWHGMLDATIPMGGPHGISLISELRRHHLFVTEVGKPYWVNLNTLGYNRSGVWGVSIIHEYSNQAMQKSDSKIWGWDFPIPEHHYLSLLASLEAPPPLQGLSMRLLFGTQRGGHKCAGGVCRDYPNSADAKLEAVYRF